ncbi:MAG: hypothetical protein ACR2JC_08365 [Chloroflexota bacterium]
MSNPDDAGLNQGVASNMTAVQTNISYNSTNLILNCSINYYSTTMFNGVTHGPYCSGGFAQVGWAKSASGTPQAFSYDQQMAGQQGCGTLTFLPSWVISTSHTYEALVSPNSGCGSGGAIAYYNIDGTTANTDCVDWTTANNIQTFTERYGSTSHMGAIRYWWTQYCTGANCVPGTAPGGKPSTNWFGIPSPRGYIGQHGITSPSWPNWNVCDNVDFNSTNC